MNNKEIESLLEIIELNNSWKYSYERTIALDHHTPIVKYFELGYDSRDMEIWKINLKVNSKDNEFRLDSVEEIEKLINFLEVTPEEKLINDLDRKFVKCIYISEFIFRIYKTKTGEQYISYKRLQRL